MTDHLEFSQLQSSNSGEESPWQQELDLMRDGTAKKTAELTFPKMTGELSFNGPQLEAEMKSPSRKTLEFPLLNKS